MNNAKTLLGGSAYAVLFAARDDPLLQNANAPIFAWFQVRSTACVLYRLDLWLTIYSIQSFIILEVLFQVPVFFLGVRGLWKRESPVAQSCLTLFLLIDRSSLACRIE